mmetsp:Transcript_5690/g.17841  ORF Transcript_5690/g.17841 Transcript_5690/m.17841 type:complete len:203 (-) Transcript_5690:469-1077(-)
MARAPDARPLPSKRQGPILGTSVFTLPASPTRPGVPPAAPPRRRRVHKAASDVRVGRVDGRGTVRRRVRERQRPERPTGVEPGSVRDRSAGGRVLRRPFARRRPGRRGSGRRRLGRDYADVDITQADLPASSGSVASLEPSLHASVAPASARCSKVFAKTAAWSLCHVLKVFAAALGRGRTGPGPCRLPGREWMELGAERGP